MEKKNCIVSSIFVWNGIEMICFGEKVYKSFDSESHAFTTFDELHREYYTRIVGANSLNEGRKYLAYSLFDSNGNCLTEKTFYVV